MATVLVLFNLKPGTDVTVYEQWARAKDMPLVRSLPSVTAFDVLRTQSVLGSDTKPPYQYAELIEVPDMAAFGADVAGDAVQAGAKQFQTFADNPLFILCDKL
jgi:hypothetical protein